MSRLFIWFILLLPLPTLAATCNDIESLSPIQKHNLSFAYKMGEPHNLGYTLAAIVLVESNAGEWRLNVRTNDLGLFQINATTAERTLNVTRYYDKLKLHQQLIYDDHLGAEIAISVLKHFERRGWADMVRSYNEGNRWLRDSDSKKKSEKYLTKIRNSVRILKSCELFWN